MQNQGWIRLPCFSPAGDLTPCRVTDFRMNRPPSSLLDTVREWLNALPAGADQRLPPERELAEKFAVSRAKLRQALSVLEKEGVIERFVGRGTYVVGARQRDVNNPETVAASTSPLAAMQARSLLEPDLAGLAALNATALQIGEMRSLCREMRDALTWDAYAELDWRFHQLIAEATANVVLVEIQRLVNGVRRYLVWGNLIKRPVGPPQDYHSFDEHERIVDAIADRNGEAARQAMLDHLGGTRGHMIDVVTARNN